MPRKARVESKSGIYHIMFRGNELHDIFIDDEDKHKFLQTVTEKAVDEEYKMYAYCLMDNHVHLLISGNHEKLGKLIKRINTCYVYFFNKKYGRIGHLFQDRYKSETVETENYLLEVIRYIHNNPVKAGMVRDCSEYKWSSFNTYLSEKVKTNTCIDIEYILKFFSNDLEKAKTIFKEFSKKESNISIIDIREDEINKEIEIKGENAAKQFVGLYLTKKELKFDCIGYKGYEVIRNELIKELRKKTDLSIRQIATVLGLSRGIVQKHIG